MSAAIQHFYYITADLIKRKNVRSRMCIKEDTTSFFLFLLLQKQISLIGKDGLVLII